ncbi:hypothetical protein Taro_047649 [Colocasia esculenta]|uniref:Aminotransferase-like plant mobile domain-containing protein n=1 Tax=Colocasia esculenta TaxID=4460 RepID=A0A843X7B6_COLES|nr:hypothetical protein [Colocasia esculenta]
MRARVSWTLVLAVFLAFPRFQRDRIEEMGFGEIFRIERMRVDSALTQALWSRWDAEATAFVFPWGHMIPSLEDVSRITGLRVYGKPASLGLYEAGKSAGESEDEYLKRLVRVSRRELASEPGAEADMDLRRFLVLFLGRLLFAMRGDTVHCRFLPLLEDLSEVGGYAWGAAFLAHQFDSLGASERQTSTSRSGLIYISQPWGEGISRGWALCPLHAAGILAEIHAISGTSWSDFRRPLTATPTWMSVWLHALNLVLPLHLHLSQHSLGLRQSVVEFPVRDQFRRSGRSFRGLHDTTNWCERAKEQINNWEHRGKAVKSDATTDDAYLQAYALKYGGIQEHPTPGRCSWQDCIAPSLTLLDGARSGGGAEADNRASNYSPQLQHLIKFKLILETDMCFCAQRRELERVRSTGAGSASSSRGAGGSPSLLEAQLAGAVLRAEEAQRHLEEREMDLRLTTEHTMDLQGQRDQLQGEIQTTRSERDQLCIQAGAAEVQVAEATKELAALRAQGPPVDQAEMVRLCTEVMAQQIRIDELRGMVKTLGEAARSRSRSRTGVSGVSGASVRQYLAGSSSRRRNEEDGRHHRGEGSTQGDRDGGEMPPPADRQEGSGESGGGQ